MLIGHASATCISACSRRLCLQRSVAAGRKEGVDACRLWRSAIPVPAQGLFNSRNLPRPVGERQSERPPAGEGPAEMFRFSSIARVL